MPGNLIGHRDGDAHAFLLICPSNGEAYVTLYGEAPLHANTRLIGIDCSMTSAPSLPLATCTTSSDNLHAPVCAGRYAGLSIAQEVRLTLVNRSDMIPPVGLRLGEGVQVGGGPV